MVVGGLEAAAWTAKTSPQNRSLVLDAGLPAVVHRDGSNPLEKITKSLLHDPWAASWLFPLVDDDSDDDDPLRLKADPPFVVAQVDKHIELNCDDNCLRQ